VEIKRYTLCNLFKVVYAQSLKERISDESVENVATHGYKSIKGFMPSDIHTW